MIGIRLGSESEITVIIYGIFTIKMRNPILIYRGEQIFPGLGRFDEVRRSMRSEIYGMLKNRL